jgi:hypothetical protein
MNSRNQQKKEGFADYTYGNYGNTDNWHNDKLYNENDFINFQKNAQNNTDRVVYLPDSQPASFNYDSLYNTNNLTQKYSFIKSSFLYRPFSTNDNDYLSQVYYNNNPLEVENMCAKLDNTTCGLTSACVYVGNDKCVPGNINGPYTVYSDINLEYYYYKGKCYGNCPGEFYPKPTPTTTPVNTYTPTYAPTVGSFYTTPSPTPTKPIPPIPTQTPTPTSR